MCNGMGIANARLADSQQCFLITEVDFDSPPPEIGLKDLREGKRGIGADQIGWLSVEQMTALARTIGLWGDDDQTQGSLSSGHTPAHLVERLDLEKVSLSSRIGFDPLPRRLVVFS